MTTAPDSLLFAAGPHGVELRPPENCGARFCAGTAPIDPAPARSETEQRAMVDGALAPLAEIARGKRRAVLLTGDLSRPAPYALVLPQVVAALMKVDIRPSRIAVAACPGGTGPLLGHAAIRRYGEEICGEHEVVAWPDSGTPGEWYDSADLKIAIAPRVAGMDFNYFLPRDVRSDFSLELGLGRKATIDLEFARPYQPGNFDAAPNASSSFDPQDFSVFMTSGGGAPWEETLEEALLSLYLAPPIGTSAVLVFSGAEGLGSGRFTCDVFDIIEQAQNLLASGAALPRAGNSAARFDPATVLAGCLGRYSNTLLFAPALAQHIDGEALLERLEEAPLVAARFTLCASQDELWNALARLHGSDYLVKAVPLGWRGP